MLGASCEPSRSPGTCEVNGLPRSNVTAWYNEHEADCPSGPSNRKSFREHHTSLLGSECRRNMVLCVL